MLWRGFSTAGFALAAAFSLAAASPACAQTGGKVPVPTNRIYFGLMASGGADPAGFEAAVGRHVDIYQASHALTDQYHGDTLAGLRALGAHHDYIMFILHPLHPSLHEIDDDAWSGGEAPEGMATPDDYFRHWAEMAKQYGRPMFIRFDHEMNAPGQPHCVAEFFKCVDPATGAPQTPEDYVKAWRHVHDIFRDAGATNVSWVWCPSSRDAPGDSDYESLAEIYPGDAYVDWTCLDGYNNIVVLNKWRSFGEIFDEPYRRIQAIAPDKPFMIAEFNSTEYPGDPSMRAEWFTDAFQHMKTMKNLRAVLLWQVDRGDDMSVVPKKRIDWLIQHNPRVLDVFQKVLAAPPFSLPPQGQ